MARYDQCDATCTTDCGHCKGQGAPGEDVAVQRFTALRLQLMQTAQAAIAAADVMDQLIIERQDQLAFLAEQPGGGR